MSASQQRRSTASDTIVPTGSGDAQTIYLVVNNFGHLGTAFAEAEVEHADLETVITDLMSGQYSDPVRVVAFNTAENWAEDVSLARFSGALILPAMICRFRSKHLLRCTPARRASCRYDSARLSWNQEVFLIPIIWAASN
jgi:hypothetical protein